MHSSNTVAEVAGNAGLSPKIEVVVENRGGVDCVAVKYLTWTEGLGWCCQKTIRVEAEQLDDVHRAITAARYRVQRHRADAGEVSQSAQVIQFPSLP